MIHELRTGGRNPLGGTSSGYPYGIPDNGISRYKNPTVYDGVYEQVISLQRQEKPYIAYIHLFSPHEPYAPRKRFVDMFEDIPLPNKPVHRLSSLDYSRSTIKDRRKQYDEYVADVDHEIGRLVDGLEAAGALESTYVILTSDHGELFERGEYGHVTRFLYEGVVRVPLVVLSPGQSARRDVFVPTSHIDVMPSILSLAGKAAPDHLEGRALPGLGGTEDPERPVFCVEAKQSSSFSSLPQATVSMVKGDHKLILYTGYPKVPDIFELYNLRQDPEELQDLFSSEPRVAARMRDELLQTFENHRPPRRKL
jgi:arylsulfatase A-like enzyme